ncbi:integrase core domain-containing protein [Microbacterium luticocti]|uniref:integrase core domain-containing protein n=1 Tax=Microbacterium luticocti TaxID=451764 RepID=UPI00146CB74E|nr:integrase core domain-containing protein [Microbacterium luticocti]
MKTLPPDLGVVRSTSRRHVSNDNPYSEAPFETTKYLPFSPNRFVSLTHARKFLDEFIHAYIHQHRHTEIGMHTPADVHYDLADPIDRGRGAALEAARRAHPERFRASSHERPKTLDRGPAACVNQPPADELQLAA